MKINDWLKANLYLDRCYTSYCVEPQVLQGPLIF